MGHQAWNKGIDHLSPEAKKRIGDALKKRIKEFGHPRYMLGKHHTEKTLKKLRRKKTKEEKERMKISSLKLEKHPMWSGRVKVSCLICGKEMQCRPKRIRKYCGYACLGKSKSVEPYKCIDCGKKLHWGSKRCKKCFGKTIRGEKAPSWKGGITPINKSIRNSPKYKVWRTKVYKRDDYTCQNCGIKGLKTLQVHHLKSFSEYPKLRFIMPNAITLCLNCHKKTDTYCNNKFKKNYKSNGN